MRSRDDRINVFTSEFLRQLAQRDRAAATVAEAEHAGPWHVVKDEHDPLFMVRRDTDVVARAELADRETALLLAAVYPALGKEKRFRLVPDSGPSVVLRGFDLEAFTGGQLEKVGWLRYDHPELLEALHVAECLLRSPVSLAMFLEAASYVALAQAGAVLAQATTPAAEEENP